jgi:3-hydroxyisobutyrate dehydrogenase
MTVERVGFIGLGNQGAPIARRIAAAGWPLTVWARRPEAAAGFGAVVAETPAALAARCDLIGICVINDDDVREVLGGPNGVLAGVKPGAIIAIHSTILPETIVELAALAAEKGALLFDAPVSGGPRGAEAGTMTVMAGGDAGVLTGARPVFESFADTIMHLGPLGSGLVVKLINNNLCFANMTMGIHALELARGLGIDMAVAARVITASSGASVGFGLLTDPVLFAKITGPGSNVAKDIDHLGEVAAHHGLGDAGLVVVTRGSVAALMAFAAGR